MPLNLNPDEKKWLDEYRQALEREYPGLIEDMVVFDAADSNVPSGPVRTVNIVVTIKGSSDRDQAMIDLSDLGDRLAKSSEVTPLIWVYTLAERERRRRRSTLPYKGAGNSVWPIDGMSGVPADQPVSKSKLPKWARAETWELNLTPDEKTWISDYRHALRENYPGLVKDLVVFGRADSTTHLPRDRTVNVVVTIKGGNDWRRLVNEISRLGYKLSVLSDVMPLIWVYTVAEWKQRWHDDTLPYDGAGTSAWLTQP